MLLLVLVLLFVIAVAFIDCARFSFHFINHFFPLLCQTAAQAHTKGKKDSIALNTALLVFILLK